MLIEIFIHGSLCVSSIKLDFQADFLAIVDYYYYIVIGGFLIKRLGLKPSKLPHPDIRYGPALT